MSEESGSTLVCADPNKPVLRVTTSPIAASASAPGMITPPETPVKMNQNSIDARFSPQSDAALQALSSLPPPPRGSYMDLNVVLGSGVWSKVTKGTLEVEEEAGKSRSKNIVVAIKTPVNVGAVKILEAEAKILSYVSKYSQSKSITRFFGFDPVKTVVLMEYINGTTLAKYSRKKKAQRENITVSREMAGEPVIGLSDWLDWSRQLSDAFVHLKQIGVVHGDVTWNNILIRDSGSFQKVPVVIDFSSGHLVAEGHEPAAISATTTAFCSPELLEAHIRRAESPPASPTSPTTHKHTPRPVPTFSSDLYGLAMTLLSTAIGAEVYENAGRHAGIYVRQGQPLDWVRNGDGFLIAGVRSAVCKMLNGCFGRTVEKRISVEDLRERVCGFIEG
jgi:serine/threonine protein kinase